MNHFQTILCPIDFSEYSKRAFSYAVSLGIHYRAKLFVQHVMAPIQTAYYGYMVPGALRQEYEESIFQQAVSVMHEFVNEVVAGRVRCEEILSLGSATSEILACAEEKAVNLIVMGTHGRSGFERFMLGSVTEKVIRKAQCPVLAVRRIEHDLARDTGAEDTIHYRTILVPVDLTEHSTQTLGYAARLAAEYGARLVVVYVLEPASYPIIDPTYSTMVADYRTEVRSEATRQLQELVTSTIKDGLDVVQSVAHGKVAQEILHSAKEHRADLIVMGARHSWVPHVVAIGTTAQRVLSHAECPVLLLRGK